MIWLVHAAAAVAFVGGMRIWVVGLQSHRPVRAVLLGMAGAWVAAIGLTWFMLYSLYLIFA